MNLAMGSIKLVVFDVDGTLVHSNSEEIPFFFDQVEKLLGQPTQRNFVHYSERTFASVINTVFDDSNKNTAFAELESALEDFSMVTDWKTHQDGFKLFTKAKDSRCEIVIVSGNFLSSTLEKLKKCNIDIEGVRVITTSLKYDSKSEIIEKIIRERKINREEILSVGDSDYDRNTANQHGIKFRLIS